MIKILLFFSMNILDESLDHQTRLENAQVNLRETTESNGMFMLKLENCRLCEAVAVAAKLYDNGDCNDQQQQKQKKHNWGRKTTKRWNAPFVFFCVHWKFHNIKNSHKFVKYSHVWQLTIAVCSLVSVLLLSLLMLVLLSLLKSFSMLPGLLWKFVLDNCFIYLFFYL